MRRSYPPGEPAAIHGGVEKTGRLFETGRLQQFEQSGFGDIVQLGLDALQTLFGLLLVYVYRKQVA